MKKLLLIKLLFTCSITLYSQPPKAQGLVYAAEFIQNDKQLYELFDHNGKRIFPDPVEWAYSNVWDWIFVVDRTTNIKKAFDYTGKPFPVDSIEDTKSVALNVNRIAIKRNGKWGFYDKQGINKIGHLYDEVSSFYKDMAAAKIKDAVFLIDTSGNKIDKPFQPEGIHYSFEDADIALGMFDFQDSDYKVTGQDKMKGLSDKQGNTLVPQEYEEILSLKRNFKQVTVNKGGKYGIVEFGGKIIIPIKYERIFVLNDYL